MAPKVKIIFPNIIPVTRPNHSLPATLNPYWVSGFTAGDGCFYLGIRKSSVPSALEQVNYRFSITQHSIDVELLNCLIGFFNCGVVNTRKNLSKTTVRLAHGYPAK